MIRVSFDRNAEPHWWLMAPDNLYLRSPLYLHATNGSKHASRRPPKALNECARHGRVAPPLSTSLAEWHLLCQCRSHLFKMPEFVPPTRAFSVSRTDSSTSTPPRASSVSSLASSPSDYLPEPAEFLRSLTEERLTRKLDASEKVLREVAELVGDCGLCGICAGFMEEPYFIECGHAFCSGCLRTWFEESLSRTLKTYSDLDHQYLNHRDTECKIIPKSFVQYLRLVEALDEHNALPRQVFRYSCPTCRCFTGQEPALGYVLRDILKGARKILGERLKVEVAKSSPNEAPFEGLFRY
ncbi:hypothetical protein H1R20_g217, partial [Candolleomyces eurysporus]